MPFFTKDDARIYYEIRGAGYPLLLLPPGGMGATIEFWERTAFNAVEIFSEHFRVIALDQRNAGRSSGPLSEGDPWALYLADHIGLLNHLGIAKCHVLGCCIGSSYALNLAKSAPERIASLVLEQPVGLDDGNDQVMPNAWRAWAEGMLAKNPDLDAETLEAFGKRMWGSDFVLSVSREDISNCQTPMLVLPGIDLFHPTEIGREVARLAPNARILEPWKEPADLVPGTIAKIRAFLNNNTPAAS
ncbi:alpha/beta fold hydrolase [Sphingobium sp. BS19]|uniref:alpha/beta fold hydrolase n=1 Tax=Sphingobium sp. BS19 TaxID=3018973 RepID=UPI0022EE1943|nr:alpha/beta hydrolase [Sphingobium sp. BS19]GLJ00505.1 hypothetical protein Sbs19_43230 [Sphingobium sp. BS19]